MTAHSVSSNLKEGEKMIQLRITQISKSYSPKDRFTVFNDHKKDFNSLEDAKKWIKEQYGKCKKVKMYAETKDGKDIHIGYIFGFRNADNSHLPVEHYIQQDWVEVWECKRVKLS